MLKNSLFIFVTLLAMVLFIMFLNITAAMAESPRFSGPEGDGRFTDTGLLQSWPPDGPPVAWVAEGFGGGYSSVAVSDGVIYLTGMDGNQTGHLYSVDMQGVRKGDIAYGPETTDEQASGPRSTPTIEGKRAYLISGLGVVYALDLEKNTVLWEVNVFERFNGENITWTLAESLLLDGDNLVCTPGGKTGVVAALNKNTGDTVWAMAELQEQASYCSPVIFTHNGRRILTTLTAFSVLGIDPATGKLLWSHEHRTDYDIHAVSPIYDKGLLYYTGGYGSGGGALKLSEDGSSVTPAWQDMTLDCQHHGVVLLDGFLYGTSHKKPGLACIEMATGKVMWFDRKVTQGNTIYADGMLYIYEGPRIGRVTLVKPSPQGLDIQGRFSVTAGTEKHWAHPAIAGGLLFIRHGDALIAYNIKK